MRSATRSRNEYGAGSPTAGTTKPIRRHASICAGAHPESRAAWIAV